MLILPAKDKIAKDMQDHQEAKQSLTNHYNKELERILNENSHKTIYWILGKVRFPEELGGKVGRAFLEASDAKPPVVKDAFLYEVDNTRGVKTLLWVCYPNGDLRMPTLNKTISVASSKGAKKSRRRSSGG
jgi:hypothetical protein